jgi:hypothetical protein
LHGAELLEEFAPTDDAFFSALEAVGAVECGGVGCCCVSVPSMLVTYHTSLKHLKVIGKECLTWIARRNK